MPKMLRAALYIRVSREEQVLHGYSIEAQKQALTEYAQKNNLHIVDYYMDEGYTARKRYTKRKEFMRMLEDVQAGNIDIILFIKLDRWFRSVRDYYKIQDILEKHNVNWKTIHENYDTSTASGRLHINIMLSVAQDEADRTSERIKFVFASKVQKGEVLSGKTAFGYKIEKKKLVIVPEKAEIVREIFSFTLKHQNISATITYIKDTFGIHFMHNTIVRMLKKRIYIGEHRGVENFCEPIVDRAVFDTIQVILKKNIRSNKSRTTYVYTGLLICPECGQKLISSKTVHSNGSISYVYRCNRHYINKICTFNKIIGEKKLDTFLLSNIEQQLSDFIAYHEIKENNTPKTTMANEREKIRNRMEKLKDLYLDDLIDKHTYKYEYEDLSMRLKRLDTKQVQKKIDINALKSFLGKDVSIIYTELSRFEKQTLWRSIIKQIHFDPVTLKPQIIFS
ncbi:DNA invertase Pin-like site-specific DNA recombinase [Anaerospora hongkongensis]|uniref:DNA invertase Pin-like site-specific DNA recombinase n=1 Tax=Anaerospora hongkongensis TaxID=244830 RepID=A0A4R1PX50_9FIRM|nr:recombinase family protein [Anaerospora hongkongensis]TCL35616.1 DNA invertase Pin-like site-specific DNA recombinase [Anaerospora hongkongensis]